MTTDAEPAVQRLQALDRSRKRARRVAWLLTPTLLVCLVIRFTVADRYRFLSVIFYAFPWPVLVLLASLTAVAWWRAGRLLEAKSFGLIAAVMLAFTAWRTYAWGDAPLRLPPSAVRVMCWNVAGGDWKRPRISAEITKSAPDLLGLVEAGGDTEQMQFWKSALCEYQMSEFRSGLLFASKHPFEEKPAVELGRSARCRHFVTDLHQIRVHVLLVDVKANPLLSRREPLRRLASAAQEWAGDSVVIMGDFNTPGDSVWFDPLRERFENAFEKAGDGYAATWPIPLPVLQLDHIWYSTDLLAHAVSARHDWSIASDHRAVLAEIAWGRY